MIIKANEIRTTSSCSGVSVRANGDAAPPAGNDGAGGGGAGGTVHLLVDNWNIDASCPLTISSNGGGGSDVGAGSKHGAGGGGGQGAVIQSGATPGGNTTTNTQPGDGGKNCNSCSSTDPGGGSNGDGNINGGNSPLPIKLLYFQAERMRSNVRLSWRTASEHENERFTVQRSKNGKAWNAIQQVEGAGTSTSPIDYSTWDMDPLDDKSYYRLRQTDKNGAQSFSDPVVIGPWNEKEAPDIYPNPAGERVWVKFGSPMTVLRIYDQRGRERNIRTEISGEEGELYVSSLSSGIYFVEFGTEHQLVRKRLIVE